MRRRSVRRRGWRAAAAVRLVAVGLVSTMLTVVPVTASHAATAYELEGEWAAGTPATVKSGDPVTATWRFSVNDDADAPGNEPVENVTATFTVEHGTFAGLPDACPTSGVTPVSSISADGATLTCNLGTIEQGTAVVVSTPIRAEGATGDEIVAHAAIGGLTAETEPLVLDNVFGMDMNWEMVANSYTRGLGGVDVGYNWTLSHSLGAIAGPNTITYTLNLTGTSVGGNTTTAMGCHALDSGTFEGHPWSSGSHPAEQMTNFVDTCTLTKLSNTQYRMTITGIDYSQTDVPTKDSFGGMLPTDRAAIASGRIIIRIATGATTGAVTMTADAPTYTPAGGGAAVTDDPSNNVANNNWLSGIFYGGWTPSFTGSNAHTWNDTYRVPAGTVVQQRAYFKHANQTTTFLKGFQCVIVDGAYLTFTDAGSYMNGSLSDDPIPGAVIEYYTGTITNPNSARPCTLATDWSATEPADLSTVSAVRLSFPYTNAVRASAAGLWVNTQVKPDTPIGQDIWSFSAYANSVNAATTASGAVWTYVSRETSGAGPSGATPTPGARYPFSFAARSILRTIGTSPTLEKSAMPVAIRPGQTTTYTLVYAAQGNQSVTPTVDDYVVTDTLPAGMTYEVGSAATAPTVTTAGGRQVLTWTFDDVAVNADHTLTYAARADADLTPGTVLENEATATIDEQSADASAIVRISENGLTQISKTSDVAVLPNAGGSGSGSWTVTVRSDDPRPQPHTDVVDILPLDGARGSDFAGSYTLSGPVTAPAGATVYYTTADPADLHRDPAHASNGSAGSIAGNTVGWSTTFAADATAVRVIGGTLATGATSSFTVPYTTTGMETGDVLVNVADGRAGHTRLQMLTSAAVSVAAEASASLKKYVEDPDNPGQWLDANDPATYARYAIGDAVTYRVVITNTGVNPVTDITVSDDLQPELGAFHIDSLGVGESEVHEYEITLTAADSAQIVNTACATTTTVGVVINCDPAGVIVVNHPDVEVAKSSTPPSGTVVEPGQTVTYRVEFANTGAVPATVDYTDHLGAVLDDADFVAGSIVGTGGIDGAFDAATEQLRISGIILAGQTASVEYQVTVKDGDELGDLHLLNVVRETGEVPPTVCEDADPLCTEHPVTVEDGELTVSKTSDPVSGTQVTAGQVVDYTVTFRNSGTAPAAVDHRDDMAAVLDDAELVDAPTLAGDSAGLTLNADATSFTVTGELAAGATARVTYSVRVLPATDRGDSMLVNFLLEGDTPTPPVDPENPACPADEIDGVIECTQHPVGELTVSKTSDPVSGTQVTAGQVVDYTLTFVSTGRGVIPVDYTDDMTHVLDDAELVDSPALTGAAHGLSVSALSNGRFTVSGEQDAGTTVTVTYSVRVNNATDRGDSMLVNFLLEGDTPTPPVDPENPACPADEIDGVIECTQHPVGELTAKKSVVNHTAAAEGRKGSPALSGDELTYTLEFRNVGEVTTAVDFSDDLTDVLDDAELVTDPAIAGKANGLSISYAQPRLGITGDLDAGAATRVTYTVTVKTADDRGDSVLTNFLVEYGTEQPAECDPVTERCTVTPVADLDPDNGDDGPGSLPITGGTLPALALSLGLVLLMLGGLGLLISRRRRAMS